MRETNLNVSKSKGELNMKRTIVILALVTAFVLAFTAVAQATWRGFTPVRTVAELGTGPTFYDQTCADVGCTVVPCPVDGEHWVVLDAADYRGRSPVTGGGMNGFITFPEARTEMLRNLGTVAAGSAGNFRVGGAYAAFGHRAAEAAGIQGTAHGGYVTTTTKCVVCHSAHRAPGLENPDAIGSLNNPGTATQRNQNQAFLTAGANTCVECHVVWGSQPSNLLVEWGGPWGNYTSGGPHAGPRRGCLMCHNAGVHGLTSSRFNVMNVFMLGNTRRPQYIADNPAALGGRNLTWVISDSAHPDFGRTAAIPAAGNPANVAVNAVAAFAALNPPITVTPAQITWFCRDTQIASEMHLWTGPDSRGNVNIQVPGGVGALTSNTWWYNGARSIGPIGTIPPAIAGLPAAQFPGGMSAGSVYGAARSMATAYTCGEAGCHTTGAFFLTNWGVGKTRADSVRTPAGGMSRVGDIEVTGHVMPSTRSTGAGNQACGPCHGGNPAGFPTASTTAGIRDVSRQAFGCDQCHDMVGVATNSTAWPHGNRNIVVYEWTAAGQQLDAAQTLDENGVVTAGPNIARAGNLWMYAGSIARSAAPGIPTNQGNQAAAAFTGPNSINPNFADQSWFVMTNVGSGRYGVPSNPGFNANTGLQLNIQNVGTGLVDGSCLKCHVALDSASLQASGAQAADALRHAWIGANNGASTGSTPTNPVWTGNIPTNSSRLFLYR